MTNNLPVLLLQAFNLLLLITWITLGIVALKKMPYHTFSETMRLIWVILILAVPVAGAAAFLMTRPQRGQ